MASDQPPPPDVGQKLDAWLESPGWEVRNAAVKLIARFRDQGRYHRLLQRLADPSEAGIVRRNAAEAIARLGLATPPARVALVRALSDPYWEVRSEALVALASLFPPAEDIERALLELLFGPPHGPRRWVREENFEVRMACARGLGHLGASRAAFEALVALAEDDFWLVRSQAAVALAHFATRCSEYLAEARDRLRRIDRLSEGAISYFVHRDVLSQVFRALDTAPEEGVAPEQLRALYLNPSEGWNHLRR